MKIRSITADWVRVPIPCAPGDATDVLARMVGAKAW